MTKELTKDILDDEISEYYIEEVCDEIVFNESKSPQEAGEQWFYEFIKYIEKKYNVDDDFIFDENEDNLWNYCLDNLSDVIPFSVYFDYKY